MPLLQIRVHILKFTLYLLVLLKILFEFFFCTVWWQILVRWHFFLFSISFLKYLLNDLKNRACNIDIYQTYNRNLSVRLSKNVQKISHIVVSLFHGESLLCRPDKLSYCIGMRVYVKSRKCRSHEHFSLIVLDIFSLRIVFEAFFRQE